VRALWTLVAREWLAAWKDRRAYWLRALYAGLLLVGLVVLAGEAVVGRLLNPLTAPDFARGVFVEFSRWQFAIVTFLAAIIFSRSLTIEKERDALDLLVLSPLRPWEILLGKMAGDFLGILALLASAVPVLSYLLVAGGVTLGEMASTHLLLAGQLAIIASFCVILSIALRQTIGVLFAAWVVTAVWLGASDVGPDWLPDWNPLWRALEGLNTIRVLDVELATIGADPRTPAIVLATGLVLLFGACVLGGFFLERQHAAQRTRGPGRFATLLAAVRAVTAPAFFFKWSPKLAHPLARRECDVRADAGFRTAWLIFVLLYFVFVALATLAPRHPEKRHLALAMFGIVAALAVTLVRTALSIQADKQRGGLEVLLSMNVEPEEIVKARFAGAVLRAGYLLVLPMVHGALVVLLDPPFDNMPWRIALALAALAFGTANGALVCVAFAVSARNAATALVLPLAFGMTAALATAGLLASDTYAFLIAAPVFLPQALAVYAMAVRDFRRHAMRRG